MNPNKIFFSVFLVSLLLFSRGEDEDDDEDYSTDEVSENVQKLRVQGADYLRKVMKQLQKDRSQAQFAEISDLENLFYTQRVMEEEYETPYHNSMTPIYNITGPTPVPDIEAEVIPAAAPPPLSLSKEELLALYEAALEKAVQLQNNPTQGEKTLISPSVSPVEANDIPVKPALQGQMGSPVSGYYYYYFPIKSFLKQTPKPAVIQVEKPTPAPPQQVHATITMKDSNKSVEPLFMAISGFIGMALMFFFSVLFMPKFNKIRSKNAQFKDTPDEMATFAQLVLEAMAGKDCSERLACEVARMFRGLNANNKPLRVLEIILPPNLAQQVSQIRKAAGKKAKCSYIPCKVKKEKPPQKTIKPKPWKKKETPHDLWMKHFEKQKPPLRQQGGNAWNRKPPAKKT